VYDSYRQSFSVLAEAQLKPQAAFLPGIHVLSLFDLQGNTMSLAIHIIPNSENLKILYFSKNVRLSETWIN